MGWASRDYLLRTKQGESEIIVNLTLIIKSTFKEIPNSWDN